MSRRARPTVRRPHVPQRAIGAGQSATGFDAVLAPAIFVPTFSHDRPVL